LHDSLSDRRLSNRNPMNESGISKVLVIGGSGMIGTPVTERLIVAGYDVAIGVRRTERAASLTRSGAKAIAIDVTRPDTLPLALAGFDAVQLILPSGPRFEDCFRVEANGAKAVAEAAKQAGIKRISYLSGASNLTADHHFPPVRAKWNAENSIKESSVPFTIWRAGWFIETLTRLVRAGVIGMPGRGMAAAHWLAASDFGDMVANAFATNQAEGKTLFAFGPELVSLRDAVRVFRDICYPGRLILSAPIPLLLSATRLVGAHEAWFGAQMLRFLEVEPEFGDSTEARRIVGSAKITIKEWCQRRVA